MNDFGPGSIDGWLSEVVGRELAAGEPSVVDPVARRLVLAGRAVDLSRLELDVLRHLQRREGVAVTREELLREVGTPVDGRKLEHRRGCRQRASK
ncbi:MAG TPA: hypothetical protein VGI55_09370, partial [Solirubrobacteraceae bacterium]